MHVALSSLTFDPLGAIAFSVLPDSTLGEQRRRMNRIATLDGGAVFNDFGFSQLDRSIRLIWQPTQALDAAIERLVQLYSRLHLATPQGFFVAAVEAYTPGALQSTLTLLVADKLA